MRRVGGRPFCKTGSMGAVHRTTESSSYYEPQTVSVEGRPRSSAMAVSHRTFGLSPPPTLGHHCLGPSAWSTLELEMASPATENLRESLPAPRAVSTWSASASASPVSSRSQSPPLAYSAASSPTHNLEPESNTEYAPARPRGLDPLRGPQGPLPGKSSPPFPRCTEEC